MAKICRSLILILIIFGIISCKSEYIPNYRHNLKSWNHYKWEHIKPQGFDYSCGSASLATLASGYFNEQMDEGLILTAIIYQLNENEYNDREKNGFSLLDLKRAANLLGFKAAGVKLPPESVLKLKGPIIVMLREEGIDHFAVLKGVYKDRAYLADPSRGNIRLPLFTFFNQWDGTALVLGKDKFGLPTNHKLAIKIDDYYRPEVNSWRQMAPYSSNINR